MALDHVSTKHLKRMGNDFEVVDEDGYTWVVLKKLKLPEGYNSETVDVLIQLPGGFPDAAPDMFWTDPILTLEGGSRPPKTEQDERHLGRVWQRWSRHIQEGHWRPGIDTIRSYVACIWRCLEKSAGVAT